MLTATFTSSPEGDSLHLAPVRVGGDPAAPAPPDRHVIVAQAGVPLLRIDLHTYGPDCFTFEEAILWHDLVIIGFGSHVHTVSLADRSILTFELGSYFGHLYPTDEYLLIASGERLFRLEPDRSLRWRSDLLGIDGVLVHDVEPALIRGDGEWDPPGGWRPFALSPHDGQLLPPPPSP